MTNDKRKVEEILKSQKAEYSWMSDGSLKTVSTILPPIRMDERLGKYTWFNNIVAAFSISDARNDASKVVTFGDGTFLNKLKVEKCQQIINESAISFEWMKNDVLLIDNKLVLHARNPFVPPRRIYAALFE